ncbi:hypothetical protein POSPLADRAFT_1045228 [Postia placenta MAD-698-R-SB12]|uniref:Uncharacterized protein n=1 Tax=Postia placenta MAD-698-R-SB12 TaxID=670580 RepID=A0A1X6N6L4_9APHY|nr:hypothetical protein POSPLADRAFT_1045228 [Postia placenta MAD-698-R-SB12]OSX64106.1 hypothetical protein POSPLADRAFT_1045228 [Postia placenta MAD-698-R-SB12]
MPFSFSFTLTVPGLVNPFSAPSQLSASAAPQPKQALLDARSDILTHGDTAVSHRRPPSPSLLPPLSRKRGWVPSDSEPSHAAAIPTSTNGYLDTPAKYRDMMANTNEDDEIEEMVADLPPAKRRRTLAGSIVSTALSAALIGTAVGLTVYRLWRDRGKQPESSPPPPYEQGEWVPPKVTPPTPRSRKSRHVAGRRTQPRHRKTHSRPMHASNSSASIGSSAASYMPIPPEFSFSAPTADPEPDADEDEDDQMSWIGDKLTSLIAEGQRALGKEIVVMSEAPEDEEDNGTDDWVEEDGGRAQSSHGGLPPYSSRHGSPLLSASPRRDRFDLSSSYATSYARSIPGSPRRRGREASVESDRFASTSFQEDESAWQTPELREAMERARQRYRREHA